MRGSKYLRKCGLLAAALLLSRLFVLPAWADTAMEKGAIPAGSTYLDTGGYAQAGVYSDDPIEVDTVRIGLSYGEDAPQRALLTAVSADGFRLGSYGEDRQFREQSKTGASGLVIDAVEGCLRVRDAQGRETVCPAEEKRTALAFVPADGGLTQYGEDRFRGGFECRVDPEGRVTVINFVGLEDYVKGVIPYEMAPNWPYEALRAQAVCARTYVIYKLGEYEDQGFDITGDTYSQVYRGVLNANERTDQAVDSTAGELVRYKGEVCQVYYSAADGGATEDGSVMFDADRPYLSGKADPFELAGGSPYASWTVRRSGEQLSTRLAKLDYTLGPVTEIVPETSAQGNVVRLELYDGQGRSLCLTGRACYSALGLNSCRYTVLFEDGDFVFQGSGLGHSCGMSQWGAYAMAKDFGYGYQDILRFYFTGVYIA